uniref:tRNA-uridine aminocarboxypropyltransferase n=1 Tax=Equus asinus TaxID=9793 RepID=A0A9L0IVL5_EQUAS
PPGGAGPGRRRPSRAAAAPPAAQAVAAAPPGAALAVASRRLGPRGALVGLRITGNSCGNSLHRSRLSRLLIFRLASCKTLSVSWAEPTRPQKVCLCPFLPVHPLHISTHLYIIQHPAEENKVLRTVPLLAACLPQDKCKVKIGRRFSEERDPELSTVCRKSGTLILYPGAEAANLEEFILDSPIYPTTIIIIDGTWSQAKDIFYKNSLFRLPTQVQLKTSISSQYVIRTQPTNRCLSTLECAAVALSILEKNIYIQETLLRPLQALCSFQLQHGAQIRLSKEHLLKNGLYPKPMPKNKRKLRKMELLMNSIKI